MQEQRTAVSEKEEIGEEYDHLSYHAARHPEKDGTAGRQEKKQNFLVSEIVFTCHDARQQMRQSDLQSENIPSLRSSPRHRVQAR
jgi:hypothetical protein